MFIELLGFLLMKTEIKEINKKNQLKRFHYFCYWHVIVRLINFIFRSLANGNCIYSSISLLLVGNNSLVENLRCLTSVELYLHSEIYGKHCCFESAEFPQRDARKPNKSFF